MSLFPWATDYDISPSGKSKISELTLDDYLPKKEEEKKEDKEEK